MDQDQSSSSPIRSANQGRVIMDKKLEFLNNLARLSLPKLIEQRKMIVEEKKPFFGHQSTEDLKHNAAVEACLKAVDAIGEFRFGDAYVYYGLGTK